jgi:iron(III) transport system ATP-binding protein
MAPVLEFRGVVKRFGSLEAVGGISFSVHRGELFTLLGPSGCGKTTTLRLAAGLEEPDEGEILLEGQAVAAPRRGIFVAPEKRRLGMVFQSYAIWPHLTVFENVAFPLRVRREKAAVIESRVLEALEMVGLAGLQSRGATALSGGQQQRVALARALVYAPAILLLDEPLSNLDAKLREQMRFELRELQRRLQLTIVYVTHDQTEAMVLSDRIAVVRAGRFEQVGSPAEIYENPLTPFVGGFLGRTLILDGTIKSRDGRRWVEVAAGSGRLLLDERASPRFAEGETVRVLARPEDIEILPAGELRSNQIRAVIVDVAYLGDHLEYHIRVGGNTFVVPAAKRARRSPGGEVRLGFDPARLSIHPASP